MMIEVNLLPQELRRVEHTPLPRFLIIIVGTTLVSVALALGAIVHMRRLPDLARNNAELDQQIASAAPSEREHDILLGQIEEVRQRKRAIAEIWRARIIWSKKLVQLSEMMPKFVGLEKLTLQEAKRSGRNDDVGGYLNLASVCAGADADRLAMFLRILRGDYPAKDGQDPWIGRIWFEDFLSIDATPWVKKDMPDYVEKEALNFTLKMAIKSDDIRLKEFLERQKKEQATKAKPTQARPGTTPAATPPTTPAAETSTSTETPADKTDDPGDTAAIVNASGRVGQ